jgi:hypothetical protein
MWRNLWFRAERQAHDAEVRDACWTAPAPERASCTDHTLAAEDQAGEIEAFLARVYTHQQC